MSLDLRREETLLLQQEHVSDTRRLGGTTAALRARDERAINPTFEYGPEGVERIFHYRLITILIEGMRQLRSRQSTFQHRYNIQPRLRAKT